MVFDYRKAYNVLNINYKEMNIKDSNSHINIYHFRARRTNRVREKERGRDVERGFFNEFVKQLLPA